MLFARAILIAGTAAVVSLIAWAGVAMQTAAPQEDYRDPDQNPAYYQAGPFLDGYHFNEMPLDPDSRFYPSSATTLSGDYYSQQKLMDVERCGDAGCHPDIYSQWYESTHHVASFNDPWYRRTFQFFDERSGRQPAQWCAGCHDPAVMMTGELVASAEIDFESSGANIGISCQFCHSVGAIDPAHTNASYQLAPSYPLPFEGTTDPVERAEGNRMLLEDEELIRRHKGDRRKPFLVLGEFCGTCHKQSLITPVNNYKWLRGFDEFDGWQNSGIPGYSARSFYYPESPMTCQNCHMPEVPSNDAGADAGLVNSHRFLGSNTALSAFHGYTRQLEATADFLADQRLTVDIFAVQPVSGNAPAALVAPAEAFEISVARGAEVGVEVVVRTRGVGHLFPGGTIDSNMAWLELALLDAGGRPLLMSGGMDEQRFVDPDAHFYRGVFLDEAGQELNKRNGWDRRAAVYVRMIPPGAADTVHFRFTVPEDAAGEIRLRARLNYRKHKQAYNRWALGATPDVEQPALTLSLPRVDTRQWVYDDSKVIELPTVLMAEDVLSLRVVEGAAPGIWTDGSPVTEAGQVLLRPELRNRFNDFGIGLLLQGDVRRAVETFRWVQQIDPAYADGFINEARAWIAEGSLGQAEAALQKAFALEPDSLKASYFMAQVAAAYGEYDRAIELLERVKRDFPYDRQVRTDLGRIDYLTGRYDDAVEELLAALQIDPEELAAHYTLMLTYQAMGEPEKAAIHESRYRRYKEDEDIQALTGP
ncbi:MAG TPA: tetratricopeptide repeat protein, partial [Acidobacteriota bacterium]